MWQKPKITPHPYSAHRRKRSRTATLEEAMDKGLNLSVEPQIIGAIKTLYGKNKMEVNQVFDGKDRGFWMLPNGDLLSINLPGIDRNQQLFPSPVHHVRSFDDILETASLQNSTVVLIEDSRVVRAWVSSSGRLMVQAVHLTELQVSKLRSLVKQASDVSIEIDGIYVDDWKSFLKVAREKNAIVTSERVPA